MDTFKSIIIAILLCCILFDPVVAAFTWLHYQKTIVKEEVYRQIMAGVDKDDLVLLKFSKEDAQAKLRWEQSKEFEYNHQMYDVVETMTLGDTVYYWCWWDHEETELNKQLEELAVQALSKDSKIKEKLNLMISYSRSLYYTFSFNRDVSVPELLYKQFFLFSYLYSSIIIQPPTPPPQLI